MALITLDIPEEAPICAGTAEGASDISPGWFTFKDRGLESKIWAPTNSADPTEDASAPDPDWIIFKSHGLVHRVWAGASSDLVEPAFLLSTPMRSSTIQCAPEDRPSACPDPGLNGRWVIVKGASQRMWVPLVKSKSNRVSKKSSGRWLTFKSYGHRHKVWVPATV